MIVGLNIDQMRARKGPFYEHYLRRRIMEARRKLVQAQRAAGTATD